MKAYLLTSTPKNWHRAFNFVTRYPCFVIVAEDEEQAREIAAREHDNLSSEIWLNSNYTTCIDLVETYEPGVALRIFPEWSER